MPEPLSTSTTTPLTRAFLEGLGLGGGLFVARGLDDVFGRGLPVMAWLVLTGNPCLNTYAPTTTAATRMTMRFSVQVVTFSSFQAQPAGEALEPTGLSQPPQPLHEHGIVLK